jgi:hypothetical protein
MPPGEVNDSARPIKRHGGVDLGHDLFGSEPVLGIIDHRVRGHAGTLYDESATDDAGSAFNVG